MPERYVRKEFPFGCMCAAQKNSQVLLTYWGKDGVFEQIRLRNSGIDNAVEGTYDSSGVIFSRSNGMPANLYLRGVHASFMLDCLRREKCIS